MIGRGLSLGLGATAALAIGAGVASPASAQERFSVDAALSGGIANNPFLQGGDTSTTASATLTVSPSYSIDQGLTQFAIAGNATVTEYLSRYPNSDSFSVSGMGAHQLSERTSLNARLNYVNSVVGAFNDTGVIGSGLIIPGVTPVFPTATADPNTVLTPAVTPITTGIISNLATDPSLGGIGRRRQNYSAGAGISMGLGPRDRIGLDTSISANRTASGALDDFNSVSQQVNYSRAIRQGFDVTAGVVVSHVDYLRRRQFDATTIQPTVGTTYLIAQNTSLSLSVGVSIVKTDLATIGDTRTSTSLSAQGSLCRQSGRVNGCLSLSRTAVPSSIGGVRIQTAASLSGGMRISERSSASASVSYSRSGAPLIDVATTPVLFSGDTEYLSANGSYNRRLSQRVSAFVSAGVSKVYGDQSFGRDPSYEARGGVRVRFGALR